MSEQIRHCCDLTSRVLELLTKRAPEAIRQKWELALKAAMETDRIARGLIARTLPKSEWTHQAHLRAGLWHALNHTDGTALDLLRERIRAYNEATGVANTANSGYHETVTRFYLHVIRTFLHSVDSQRPVDELALELIARFGDRDLPLRYYTPERLFSAEARFHWVEPDREKLSD